MTTLYFETWDWDRDCGQGSLPDADELPESYAEVQLDWRGFPFRVAVRNPPDMRALDQTDDEVFLYDYYCDDHGRIREKRSLDEDGCVCLIVRYGYEGDEKTSETGWDVNGEEPPKAIRTRD